MSSHAWRSPLFFFGLAVWAVCLAAWGLAFTIDAKQALSIGATFAAFLVSGKLAAIPLGLGLGLSPLLVGLIVFVPDLGAVLVAFPLTEKGVDVLGRWSRVIHRIREQAHENAKNKRGLVARYESWGLFLISLTPVAFISPLVVSAIGQVMGLPTRRVLVPVIAGMVVMTVALVAIATKGLSWAARFDRRIPLLFAGLVLAGFVSWEVVSRVRDRKNSEAA